MPRNRLLKKVESYFYFIFHISSIFKIFNSSQVIYCILFKIVIRT